MKNIFVLIGFFSLSVFAQSENCHHTLKTFFCVEYVKNYDGDTITVTIPYLHPLFGKEIPIRLSGIDTAELTGKHPCEKKMAKIAKNYLGHRLKKAKPERIELREISRDKYFRILAEVWANGYNLSAALLKNHLAVEYYGGIKKEIDWCAQEAKMPSYLESYYY